jgi:hypothetical protein
MSWLKFQITSVNAASCIDRYTILSNESLDVHNISKTVFSGANACQKEKRGKRAKKRKKTKKNPDRGLELVEVSGHTYQIDCPNAIVLSHWKRRKRSIACLSDRGHILLFNKKVKVELPDLRHLVHRDQCSLERVIESQMRSISNAQMACSLITFFKVCMP